MRPPGRLIVRDEAPPPSPTGKRRLRDRLVPGLWPVPLVIATAAIIFAAPGPLSREGPADDAAFGADSYTRIINQGFVPLNWLIRVEDPVTGAPSVALSREALRHDEVVRFVRGSYLGQDLTANDPDLWHFEGRRVRGINPNAHNLRDPFTWRGGWQGNIGFRDEATDGDGLGDPFLITSKGTLIRLSGRYRARDEIEEAGFVSIDSGAVTGDTSRGFEFHDSSGITVATLRMVGNRPVIVIRCDASRTHDASITTAGYAPRSCQAGGAEDSAPRGDIVVYPLADEDRIVFRLRASPTSALTVQLAYGQSLISRYRPFGPRLFGPPAGNIARDVAQAMDWTASLQGHGADLATRSLMLTLDRGLQQAVDDRLLRYANELLTQLGRDPQDVFPAAVTVMDATNGELLALGSFPDPEQLTNWEARTSSFARNQNFVALPIGSAAKVPVAAAILGRFPDLRNLCILGTQPDSEGELRIHEVAGIALRDSIGDTVAAGDVDFDRFLRNSSNRYGAALITLATVQLARAAGRGDFVPLQPRRSAPLAPHDQFSLRRVGESCPGSTRYVRVPAYLFLPVGRSTAGGARTYQGVEGLPMLLRDVQGGTSWIDWLQHHFALDAVAGDPRPTTFDPTIWRPLLGADRDLRLDRYFARVSPDRERFGLGSVHDIREYMMVILGGGNARWTAVKLAEAYARVMMGREINAQLVLDNAPSRQRLAFWPLPGTARRALLAGMAQAAAPDLGGTARRLGEAARSLPVAPGQQIRIFAKTGTPTLEEPERSRLNRLINTLIQTRILIIVQGRLAVAGGRGEAPGRALARLAADRQLPYDGADTSPLLARIDAINAARAEGRGGGLMFDRDSRLSGIQPDRIRRRYEEASEGGVAAFVIGRYCASDAASTAPLRALSIVVNVQARTEIEEAGRSRSGPNPAIELGARLLARDGALANWLLADGPNAAPCSS